MKKRSILCIMLALLLLAGLMLTSCSGAAVSIKKSRRWTPYEHYTYNVESTAKSYEEASTQNVMAGVPYDYSKGTTGTYDVTIKDQADGHTKIHTELSVDGVYKFDYKSKDGSTKTYSKDGFTDTIISEVEFSGYTNFKTISSKRTINNTAIYLVDGEIKEVELNYQITTTYNDDLTVASTTIYAWNNSTNSYSKPLEVNGTEYETVYEYESKKAFLDNEIITLFLRCMEYNKFTSMTQATVIPFDEAEGELTITKITNDITATVDYYENGSNVFSCTSISIEQKSSNFSGGKMYIFVANNDAKHIVNDTSINEKKVVMIQQNGLDIVLADYEDVLVIE